MSDFIHAIVDGEKAVTSFGTVVDVWQFPAEDHSHPGPSVRAFPNRRYRPDAAFMHRSTMPL